jgi:DNA repair protein RadC
MNKHYSESEFLSIKAWAEDDRPREKLILKGKSALSDAELLAILIGSGSRNESAVQLSQRILQSVNNNLYELSRLSVKDLCKFKGMGEAKAVSIIAALEVGLRQKATLINEKPKVGSSKDGFNLLVDAFSDLNIEEFHLLVLNQANQVVGRQLVSRGGITGTVVDVRVVARAVLDLRGVAAVVSHNHPSGNLKPSQADIELTQKLKKGLSQLDIRLMDHLIICGNTYYSFADNGLL